MGVVIKEEDPGKEGNKDEEEEGIQDIKRQTPSFPLSASTLGFTVLSFHEGIGPSKKGKPFPPDLPLF